MGGVGERMGGWTDGWIDRWVSTADGGIGGVTPGWQIKQQINSFYRQDVEFLLQ